MWIFVLFDSNKWLIYVLENPRKCLIWLEMVGFKRNGFKRILYEILMKGTKLKFYMPLIILRTRPHNWYWARSSIGADLVSGSDL